MDKIFELLMRQPIVALFLIIWVVGVITNAVKGKQKARESSPAKPRPTPAARAESADLSSGRGADVDTGGRSSAGQSLSRLGTGQQKKLEQQRQAPASMRSRERQVIPPSQPASQAQPSAKTPDQVAREMRRILGLDPDPPAPVSAPAAPSQPPPLRSEPVIIDRASAALRDGPSRAEEHIDSDVGERIRDRHMAETKVGKPRKQPARKPSTRGAIGSLGGRTKVRVPAGRPIDAERRYAMTDLRKVIVMNEILSPPVAMRDSERLF